MGSLSKSVGAFRNKTVKVFPDNNAGLCLGRRADPSPEKNANRFQGVLAETFQERSVTRTPGRTARPFPRRSVSTCPTNSARPFPKRSAHKSVRMLTGAKFVIKCSLMLLVASL